MAKNRLADAKTDLSSLYCVAAQNRDWPWVQSGFFTLHAITMLMKMHSYIAYNGELSEKLILLKKAEKAYAQHKKDDAMTPDDHSNDTNDQLHDTEADTTSESSSSLPDSPSSNDPATDVDQDLSVHRHHRLASEAAAALLQEPATLNSNVPAAEIEELKSDLKCQNGELWPANVTIANFIDYLIVPSLIYELQYPRTTK